MSNLFEMILQGKLDIKDIEKTLKALQSKELELNAKLNNTSLKNVEKQVNKSSAEIAKSVFNVEDLDKQGRLYFSKVSNTIDKMMPSIKSKFGKLGFDTNTLKVSGIETARGTIQSFAVSVQDANDQLKTFNFQRNLLQGSGKTQTGLIQTDSVKVVDSTNSQLQKTLNFMSVIDSKIKDINSKTFNLTKPLVSDNSTSLYNERLSGTVKKINEIKSNNEVLSDEHKRQIGTMVSDLDRYRKELQNVEYAATKLKPDTFSNAQKQLQATLQTNVDKWNKSGLINDSFKKNISDAQTMLNTATKTEHLDEYRTKLKLISEEFKRLNQENQSYNRTDTFSRTQSGAINKINSFLTENTKLTSSSREQFTRLKTAMESAGDSRSLRNLVNESNNLQRSLRAAGETGRSFGDEMKNNLKKFSQWVGASAIFFGAQRAIKGVVSNVIELNTEMTSLKKVTEATDAQFEDFLVKAINNAKTLGASITDIVKSTSEFSRLGYNLPDSTELARVATLYKNVGDGISIGDSSESIISTMKAFGIAADDVESIVDKFNEVGNNFSISSAGIGEALKRSASALKEANNGLSESIALQVGANNVIQDPETVGTMWKTVAMRIRGASTELEEAGLETDGMVKSTSKLQNLIQGITGFNIMMPDNKTFKSTYDIVVGIGKEYSKLSDIDQASLLETLAGKLLPERIVICA